MNENLVESDAVDLKISRSGDEPMSLYRITQIQD